VNDIYAMSEVVVAEQTKLKGGVRGIHEEMNKLISSQSNISKQTPMMFSILYSQFPRSS